MVVELLLARHQLLAVGGREKEAAALLVPEELDGEPRESVRLLEPAQLAGRDVQLVEPIGDVGVVLQVTGIAGLPGPPAAMQAAVLIRKHPEQELSQLPAGLDELRAIEPAARLRERRQREAVPGGDRLVVAERLRSPLADLEQPPPEPFVA